MIGYAKKDRNMEKGCFSNSILAGNDMIDKNKHISCINVLKKLKEIISPKKKE